MTLKIYKIILLISLKKLINYKNTNLMIILFTLIFNLAELINLLVIYQFTDNISGYSFYDYLIIISSVHLATQLYIIFNINSHDQLFDKIVEGELDYDLLKPINSRSFLSFREIELSGFVSLCFPLGVFCYALSNFNLSLLTTPMVFLGILIQFYFFYILNSIAVALGFWFERASFLLGLVENSIELFSHPRKIFPSFVYLTMAYLFPILLSTNLIIDMIYFEFNNMRNIIYFIFFTTILRFFLSWLWKKGTKKYCVSA